MVGYNCINCHSFCQDDLEQMLFHMRAIHDGTYMIKGNSIEKLWTKTDHTTSNMTYPFWHPTGRFVAASVNDTKQLFHSVKEKKWKCLILNQILLYMM